MDKGLFDRRLLFVTGKGGVGKSTIALALGTAAARSGRRTIVAELSGGDRLQRAYGLPGGRSSEEIPLDTGLFTIAVEPLKAMAEYLSLKAPGPFGRLLTDSSAFQTFAMATPGMPELLSLGKVWELAQTARRAHGGEPYDLVIVDAPATGHGVGVLKAPRTFAEIARVGPIATQASMIDATLHDPDFTAMLAVCTPEEMPVNETFTLAQALERERLPLEAVLLNRRYPDRFSGRDAEVLAAAPPRPEVLAALSEHRRAEAQAAQHRRLEAELSAPIITLPYLFAAVRERDRVDALADCIARSMST